MTEDINNIIDDLKRFISKIYIDIDKMIVENILAAGLLMLIVSEYEKEIKKIFINRATMSKDCQITNFAKNMINEKIRNIKIDTIAGMLGKFDIKMRKKFRIMVEDSGKKHMWDTLIENRHRVAHKGRQFTMTIRDIETMHNEVEDVMEYIKKAISMK